MQTNQSEFTKKHLLCQERSIFTQNDLFFVFYSSLLFLLGRRHFVDAEQVRNCKNEIEYFA